jgi:hypothetical protein
MLALVVPVAFSLAGCGTICNLAWIHAGPDGTLLTGPPEVYGGVANDAALPAHLSGKDYSGQGRNAALGCLCLLAEFPLSLCADTLTLPITLTVQQIRNAPGRISESTRQELGRLPAEGGYGAVTPPAQPARAADPPDTSPTP